jgi:hypothetical protein
VPWIHLKAENLTLLAGKPVEFKSSSSVIRTFCGRCGTPITYWHESYGRTIDVTTCSLDDPERFPLIGHVWTSHGLSWLHLADGLPAFEEEPPADML